jgi:hypothetical protein
MGIWLLFAGPTCDERLSHWLIHFPTAAPRSPTPHNTVVLFSHLHSICRQKAATVTDSVTCQRTVTQHSPCREPLNVTFLLLLALQPTVGLAFWVIFFYSALSSHCFLHRLTPIICKSSSMPAIHLFPLVLVPTGFHYNILLGVLLSSIRITWPRKAILLLFINLTISSLTL